MKTIEQRKKSEEGTTKEGNMEVRKHGKKVNRIIYDVQGVTVQQLM